MDVPGLLLGLVFVVWLGLLQILLDVCGLELCLVCVLLDLLCGFVSWPFAVLLVSVIYVVQLGVWWFGVVVVGLFICLFGVGPVLGCLLVGSLGGACEFWIGLYVAVADCLGGLIFTGFWFGCFAIEGWLLYLRVCCFVWVVGV